MSDLLTRLDSAYKSSLEVGDLWNLTEEAAERIRELEALLEEAQGILIDSMLDEGYSAWMDRANKALEPPQ